MFTLGLNFFKNLLNIIINYNKNEDTTEIETAMKTKVSINAKLVKLIEYILSNSFGFLEFAKFKLPNTTPVARAAKPNVNINAPHIIHLKALINKNQLVLFK